MVHPFACAVCFGSTDSPLQIGLNFGIMSLLLVTGGVLSAFTVFFFQLWRRARLAEHRLQSHESSANFTTDGSTHHE